MRMLKCSSSFGSYSGTGYFSESQHMNENCVVEEFMDQILMQNSSPDSSVFIKDVSRTRRKINALVNGGSRSIQVVSDFDRTMSKYRHNGKLIPTCHGIFEMDPELTESAKSKLRLLRDKYYPIEIDPSLSDAEKVPHMLDWWNVSHETIVSCGLHREALVKTVRDSCVVLRDGVREFMELLWSHSIPVLIFSAGLGDVIEILLKNFNMYRENIRVVSNFMRFNEEGLIVGFKDPVIHSFNKTAASILNEKYSGMTSVRSSVILLGDSTADVHMADGATINDPQGILSTVLRIGFLNESVEKHLEKYKDIYDIVLVNDDSFTVPLAIIQNVLRSHQSLMENTVSSADKQSK